MIANIEFNKKYKQFAKDTKTPHPLKKYNLFYGMNGTGKSTLSRLFYILEEYQKNPNFNINDSKYTEIQNAQLTYDDKIINWNNLADFYRNNDVSVRVFNQEFIRRTININDCDSIVFGDENKEVQDKIQRLETENEKIREQINNIGIEKSKLKNPSFDCLNKSQHFVNQVIQDNRLITNHKFSRDHLQTMLKNPTAYGVKLLSEKEETRSKNIIKGKSYRELETPTIDLNIKDLIDQVKKILSQTVVSKTIDRLESNDQLKEWVRVGYSQFSKTDNNPLSENCPFCEQSLSQEFWNTLSESFTNEETDLLREIDNLKKMINGKIKILNDITFYDSSELYPSIIDQLSSIEKLKNNVFGIKNELEKLNTELDNKKDTLDKALEYIVKYDNTFQDALNEYISMIVYHKEEVKNDHTNKTSAVEELKRHYIAKLVPEYQDYKQKLATYKAEIEKLDNDISNLNIKINTNSDAIQLYKNKLKNVDVSISNINTALNDYLGHNSIKFINVEKNDGSKFKLVRLNEQEEIVHTDEPIHLSEGETTLVAFIYFIQQLNHKNENKSIDYKENYIIVIDDPITSMDVDFIYYIINMIRGLLDDEKDNKLSYQFKQVIFLTHHFMLFRELWKILHDSRDNKYKLFFSNYLLERKSKYLSIDKLPEFYKKHDTEYLYIFQSLHNLGQELDDYQLKYYAPNLSRKLLDVFTAFKYAHNKDKFKEEFKSQCESQLGFDYTTLKRYTDSGSHLERYDMVNFQIIKEMPKKILQCIEILDKEHYDCMIEKIK